jgi:hypothetical protein
MRRNTCCDNDLLHARRESGIENASGTGDSTLKLFLDSQRT